MNLLLTTYVTLCKLILCRWPKKWATTASWRTGFELNALLIPRSWTQTYDGGWIIWQLSVTMIYRVMILDTVPKCLATRRARHLHCPVRVIFVKWYYCYKNHLLRKTLLLLYDIYTLFYILLPYRKWYLTQYNTYYNEKMIPTLIFELSFNYIGRS